jgi:proton glutamate symport protein
MPGVSLTTKVLIGLFAGLALGAAISASHSQLLIHAATAIEPLGILFINAIRMTVMPLVIASLIVSVISTPDIRMVGRLGLRALLLFVTCALAAATFAALAAPPLLRWLAVNASAFRSASTVASEGATKLPGFAQWLTDLAPANPFKAASDGAMLPLIIFSLAFGLAATRVAPERRQALQRFFEAVAEAMMILVRWILVAAPIGVFALALPLAVRLGISAAGALLYYIVLVCGLTVIFIAGVMYPLAALGGGMSLGAFARAAAPPQAVAFSSRSSLAALPAMIESGRNLSWSTEITGFLLPLAASVFRVGGAIAQVVGVLFLAKLYGVTIGATQLMTIVVTVVLTTFSIPGVPAGSILVIAPVLAAAGLPVEGIGLLIGVDTIPDMFRTTANTTGGFSVAAVLARRSGNAVRASTSGS